MNYGPTFGTPKRNVSDLVVASNKLLTIDERAEEVNVTEKEIEQQENDSQRQLLISMNDPVVAMAMKDDGLAQIENIFNEIMAEDVEAQQQVQEETKRSGE